ncbi:hypothetical protein [Nostoc sp. CALU 1950]|uniref:hypothetical protein n=1 Tax=Nostoc sp. CALU 1950 TaxID=3104321 RepID=UPI003EC1399B
MIILNLGLFLFILNTIIFALTAYVVEHFRLRWCFWSLLNASTELAVKFYSLEYFASNYLITKVIYIIFGFIWLQNNIP